MTRCKLTCQSVRKTKSWIQGQPGEPIKFLFESEFTAVLGGSAENTSFFEATPNAIVKLGVHKEEMFVPGKSYYFDISEAP